MKEQELELRAWDKAARVMHYNVMTDGKSVIAKWNVSGEEDILIEPMIYSIGKPGLFILMEFTGLLDKDGKKIFDRDTVSKTFEYEGKAAHMHGTIEWSAMASQWWIRWMYDENKYAPLTPDYGDEQLYCTNVQVIGHFYEADS